MPTRAKARPARTGPMPDIEHLYLTGHLYPDEARQLSPGGKVMTCIECGREVALLTTFEPFTPAQMAEKKRVLPGLIWGKDLIVACPCCSLDGCPHQVPDTRPTYHDGGTT